MSNTTELSSTLPPPLRLIAEEMLPRQCKYVPIGEWDLAHADYADGGIGAGGVDVQELTDAIAEAAFQYAFLLEDGDDASRFAADCELWAIRDALEALDFLGRHPGAANLRDAVVAHYGADVDAECRHTGMTPEQLGYRPNPRYVP